MFKIALAFVLLIPVTQISATDRDKRITRGSSLKSDGGSQESSTQESIDLLAPAKQQKKRKAGTGSTGAQQRVETRISRLNSEKSDSSFNILDYLCSPPSPSEVIASMAKKAKSEATSYPTSYRQAPIHQSSECDDQKATQDDEYGLPDSQTSYHHKPLQYLAQEMLDPWDYDSFPLAQPTQSSTQRSSQQLTQRSNSVRSTQYEDAQGSESYSGFLAQLTPPEEAGKEYLEKTLSIFVELNRLTEEQKAAYFRNIDFTKCSPYRDDQELAALTFIQERGPLVTSGIVCSKENCTHCPVVQELLLLLLSNSPRKHECPSCCCRTTHKTRNLNSVIRELHEMYGKKDSPADIASTTSEAPVDYQEDVYGAGW